MKSGKKPSPKKLALLDVGKEQFLAQGYHATSIDAICDAAEVTKGSFFYYFKTKQDFAEALLAHIWQPIFEMREAARRDDGQPLKHLSDHIRFMVNFIQGDGRLMGIISQELGQTQPETGQRIRAYFGIWVEILTELVEATSSRHATSESFEPTSLVDIIIAVVEGTPFIARMRGEDHVEHTIRHLENYLSILFNG